MDIFKLTWKAPLKILKEIKNGKQQMWLKMGNKNERSGTLRPAGGATCQREDWGATALFAKDHVFDKCFSDLTFVFILINQTKTCVKCRNGAIFWWQAKRNLGRTPGPDLTLNYVTLPFCLKRLSIKLYIRPGLFHAVRRAGP